MEVTESPAIKEAPSEYAEILSDEQIERLLQQAEQRLHQNSLAKPSSARVCISKLSRGLRLSPTAKGSKDTATTTQKGDVNKQSVNELKSIDAKAKRTNDATDAGANWFNLPKTDLTTSLKRDLQLIEMRSVLDPHRHYKKSARKGKVPQFSQVGTVVGGPTDWFSGRLNNKDRSQTFVEEAMRTERENGRFKRKYSEIQDMRTSGKKAYYKKLMAKRQKKS